MTIGERIKEVRTRLNISQVAFADKIGVSKQTLYKYENNIITNIPSDKIEAVAEIGKVSPAFLMGWEEDESLCAMTIFEDEIDDYTQELGEFLYYNPNHRVLFDSIMNVKPADVELAKQMLDRINGIHITPQENLLMTAHNDHADEPDEQEKMQEDIANLKRLD